MALVVTIVILIILATISINAVLGEKGLIKKAQQAKEMYEKSVQREEEEMNLLLQEYENAMKNFGDSGGDITDPNEPEIPDVPTGPNGKPLVDKDTVSSTDPKL